MPATEAPSVFLDADVLVAGSFSSTGASHLILRLAELGVLDAVSSEQARREAERNLSAKLPAGLASFRLLTSAAVRWIDDPSPADLSGFRNQAHRKDLPILAAAVNARCVSLVTFNTKDFRPRGGSIRVERPADFMQRLRETLAKLAE